MYRQEREKIDTSRNNTWTTHNTYNTNAYKHTIQSAEINIFWVEK